MTINEIKSIIDSEINSAKERITCKAGGAQYDYANFCISEDFDWLREEIKLDLEHIIDYIERDLEEDEDLDMLLEDFFEETGEYKDWEDFIYSNYTSLEYEVNSLESEILYASESKQSDLVYNHLCNAVEDRHMSIEKAIKDLETNLVEKSVITVEELEELEGYKKAITKYKPF